MYSADIDSSYVGRTNIYGKTMTIFSTNIHVGNIASEPESL